LKPTRGTTYASEVERYDVRRSVRRIPHTLVVGLAVLAVSLTAGVISMWSGYATAYPDAESHLTVARRLWDGPDAGFGQLGTVWLPLPHLLLAPLTWLTSTPAELWRIGLAGVLLSSVALALTAGALYRVMVRLGVTYIPAIIAGLAVLVLNPTMLYISTTALTEPLLMAGLAMAAAGLSGFIASARPLSGGEVALYIGAPAALATGSRYDGWVFTALMAALLYVMAWRRWDSWRFGLRTAVAFTLPSLAVAVWWILLNWVSYGDPLAFQRGPYSAQALQEDFARLGLLPTQGSWVVSAETYGWTVWATLGALTVIAALLGFILLAFQRPFGGQAAVGWLLLFPFAYHVTSLYSGQSVIWSEVTLPPGLFNTRYAVPLLLAAAVSVAFLVHSIGQSRFGGRRPRVIQLLAWGFVAALVVTGPVGTLREPSSVPALAEAQGNLIGDRDLTAATDFLRSESTSSSEADIVLIDETVNVALVRLGWDFTRVLGRFSDDFDTQLDDPTTRWVLARDSPQDAVWQAMGTNPRFDRRYIVVFQAGDVVVLERLGGSDGE
jgi:hypothetical protein